MPKTIREILMSLVWAGLSRDQIPVEGEIFLHSSRLAPGIKSWWWVSFFCIHWDWPRSPASLPYNSRR